MNSKEIFRQYETKIYLTSVSKESFVVLLPTGP